MRRNKEGSLIFDNELEKKKYEERRNEFLRRSDTVNEQEIHHNLCRTYSEPKTTQNNQVFTSIYNKEREYIEKIELEVVSKAIQEHEKKLNTLGAAMLKLRGSK